MTRVQSALRHTMTLLAVASLSLGVAACDKKGGDKAKGGDKKAETKKDDKKAEGKKDDKKADDKKADDKKAEAKKADDKKADDKKADKPAEAKKDDKAAAKTAEAKPADKPADKPAEAKAAGAETYIKFQINHHDTSKGMVNGSFKKFSIKEAVVDLKDLSKSKAVIEVDISSVDTGIAKRDGHLKSPDFFDIAKFATATATVAKIGAEKDGAHPAEVTIDLHGVKKTMPVSFKIVEKKDDGSIIVEATTDMKRQDFQVGGEPAKTNAANDLKLMVRLHVKSTS